MSVNDMVEVCCLFVCFAYFVVSLELSGLGEIVASSSETQGSIPSAIQRRKTGSRRILRNYVKTIAKSLTSGISRHILLSALGKRRQKRHFGEKDRWCRCWRRVFLVVLSTAGRTLQLGRRMLIVWPWYAKRIKALVSVVPRRWWEVVS
jgi:hypothetical protein